MIKITKDKLYKLDRLRQGVLNQEYLVDGKDIYIGNPYGNITFLSKATASSLSNFKINGQTTNKDIVIPTPTVPTISDTAYGVSWNTNLDGASKNALYDKFEADTAYNAATYLTIANAATTYLPLAGGTLTGNLLFSADNTRDIGASGATRPRTGYFGTSIAIGTVNAPSSKLNIGVSPTASANYGLVSLGSGAFDGSTSGFFIGSTNGTLLAGNLASSSTSDLLNLQLAGSNRLRVYNNGDIYGRFNVSTPMYNGTTGSLYTNRISNTSNSTWIEVMGATSVSSGNDQIYLGGRNSQTSTSTSGTRSIVSIAQAFTPTSGTAIFNQFSISSEINQTGGANGITRGIYINQILTSAADYRAFETARGKIIFADAYAAGSGSLAGSILNINQTFNTTGTPTSFLYNVTNTASNAASLVFDWQIGGSSKFKMGVANQLYAVLNTATTSNIIYYDSVTGLMTYGAVPTSTTYTGSTGITLVGSDFQIDYTRTGNIYTGNGLVSSPLFTFNGTWYTGGTATTTKPYILIEPTGTTSTTWSTTGTGLGINTSNTFTGNIFDFKYNNTTRLSLHYLNGLFLTSSTFKWEYNGDIYIRYLYITSGNGIFFGNGSFGRIWSTVDSIVQLTDSSNSTFDRLQFGGSTSSFPSWQRSTTGLIARLADNSADTWIRCSTLELGAATDTTLSRSSAGIIAVEGVIIPTISSTHNLTNKTYNGLTITANGTNTLNIAAGGSLITSGAYAATFTFTGATGVTFPTSGTLLTTTGSGTGLSGVALLASSNTFTQNNIFSYSSTVSTPALNYTGGWFGGGTSTTTKPHWLLEPTGTSSTTWNTQGTGFGINSDGGFTGDIFNFKKADSLLLKLDYQGLLTGVNGTFTGNLTVADDAYDATNWNSNNNVPTKNAIRDKIESLTLPTYGSSTPSTSSYLDLTNVTQITYSYLQKYTRIGDLVFVSGSCVPQITTTGVLSSFEIPIPVNSNMSTATDVSGIAEMQDFTGQISKGDNANCVQVTFPSSTVLSGQRTCMYVFSYKVD